MSQKNFVVKNGLTVGVANIDAATGNLFSGNANLGNLASANFFSGNANALFNIQGANVTGTVANATHASTANTVTTAAQPNITSVGTLSSLAVTGNASVGGILTDNYYYSNGSPVDFQQAAGSNTQLQFNNNDDFGASANLTFDSSTNVLKVTGNANVTNTLITPNISTSGAFTLTANGQSTTFNANGIVDFPANVSAPNFIGNVVGNITGNIAAQGSNTDVQFNDGGILGGSNAFTFNKSSNVLTVAGNVDFENADLGNLALANYVNVANDLTLSGGDISGADDVSANTLTGTLTTAAQPNVTSVGTLTSLAVTGNTTAGNVYANSGTIGANLLTGTLTTAAQPNVTSVGTLTSLTVSGNASAGNISATDVSGTTLGGSLTTASRPNITSVGTLTSLAVSGNASAANMNAGNLLTANYVAGTLTTNAQPNVTSVGTLSSLDVTGNVTTSANLVTDLIVGKTSGVTVSATGSNQSITLTPTGTGVVDVSGKKVGNLAAPTSDSDAATKLYVDEVAQGLDPKASVSYATAAALPAFTYNNGTSGVGATITANANGAFSIDGSTPSANDRVLIKNEVGADAPYNGIYVVTTVGDASNPFVLTRSNDFDGAPGSEIPGAFVFVEDGSTNADTGWVCITNSPVSVGTTDIVFTQFAGAGTYTAGTGLTLTGTVFSISNTAVTGGSYGSGDAVASFTVNSQGQLTAASNVAIAANAANLTGSTLSSNVTTSSLTSVGTLGSLSVTGNVSAGNVSATDVSGTTLGGSLTTAAQPNVTSVGTLTSLAVTGNVSAGNLSATDVSGTTLGGTLTTAAQPNITSVGTLANLTVSGLVTADGVDAGNIVTANYVEGTLTTAAQPNITSTGILSSLTVSGNASAANMNAGNLLTANYVAGTLTTAAQPNITSVGTLTSVSITGNALAGNVYANSGTIGANLLTGTLTTAAQPNITSVGNLSSLNVTGNVIGGNIDAGSLISAGAGNISGNLEVGSTVNTSRLSANVADGTAPFVVVSTTKVANLNVDFVDGFSADVSANADTLVARDASGNVSANYFIGDGSQLTGIDTSMISNGTSNVIVYEDDTVAISATGTANVAVFSDSNLSIDGDLFVTGDIEGLDILGNNITGNTLTGTLTTNAQPNVTSVGTLTSLSVTGTTLSGNVYANSGTIGASSLAGTLTTAAQPNITSVGSLTSLTVVGNVSAGNLSGANLVDASYLTGTLTVNANAQPNITSVGTLTSLTTSGNAVVGGNVKVQVGITSNRANVAVGNTDTVIDEFSTGDWRTAKYVISGSGDDGHQSAEVILVHDGTNAYISIYGSICSNASGDLFELSANVDGVSGNVTVFAVSDSDNCYLNLISQYIKT